MTNIERIFDSMYEKNSHFFTISDSVKTSTPDHVPQINVKKDSFEEESPSKEQEDQKLEMESKSFDSTNSMSDQPGDENEELGNKNHEEESNSDESIDAEKKFYYQTFTRNKKQKEHMCKVIRNENMILLVNLYFQ